MPILTEPEYDALEDETTRNPPDVDPARSRHPARMITADDFSTDWLRIKADTTHTGVGQITHSMARDRMAATFETRSQCAAR